MLITKKSQVCRNREKQKIKWRFLFFSRFSKNDTEGKAFGLYKCYWSPNSHCWKIV